jgi:hypothetical protein
VPSHDGYLQTALVVTSTIVAPPITTASALVASSVPLANDPMPSSAAAPKTLLDRLTSRIKLPADSAKLTPSQLLFAVSTGLDPRSMTIKGDEEFYLFMEMRAERQWVSFGMNSRKWVTATVAYNNRLESANATKGVATVKKNPRALVDFLGSIEPKISRRILDQDFICA